jgi:2'-5' RNA ligase
MRIFVGILIPDDLKPKITKIQKRFSKFDIKLVEPENLHFNLKFIREIGENELKIVKNEMLKLKELFEPFVIRIKGIGAFPNERYVRVIWLGVKEGKQTLMALAQRVDDIFEKLSFERDRDYIPHLTLGRVRSGKNKDELLSIIKELNDVDVGEMLVKEIDIVRSTLTPKGPIYKSIFSISLGDNI